MELHVLGPWGGAATAHTAGLPTPQPGHEQAARASIARALERAFRSVMGGRAAAAGLGMREEGDNQI